MSKISIIIPNYNHAKFLPQRLESIFNQTFQDFEIILLDDCSTDNSVEILESYALNSKVSHFIINRTNSGSTFKQWEKGIQLAKGDYIWIAESDDWAEETFLEECMAKIQENKDCNIGLINCNSNVIFDNKIKIETKNWLRDYNKIFSKQQCISGKLLCQSYLVENNIIPNASAVLINKSILNKIKIPKDYKISGDWQIWFEILFLGDFIYIDKPLNNFRIHSTNTTYYSNDARLQEEGIKFLRYAFEKLKREKLLMKSFYFSYLRWCFGAFWGKSFSINLKNFNYYFYKFDINLIVVFITYLYSRLISKIRL